jgi:hypothetical protein
MYTSFTVELGVEGDFPDAVTIIPFGVTILGDIRP